MKKFFILLFCFMLAGCTPVERNNPTDPKSPNYDGWTFLGEVGNFTQLSDFVIVYNTPPVSDYIYCLDTGNKSLSRYLVDGTYDNILITNLPPPATPIFYQPSSICLLNGYLYTVDSAEPVINAFYLTSLSGYTANIAAPGNRIASCNTSLHTSLYVAVSSTPAVYEYTSDTTGQTYTLQNQWTTLSGTVTTISDIEIHSNTSTAVTDVMIVDPVMKKLDFFDLSGNFEKSINVGTDIIGAASYNDNIYVPTSNGIMIIDYNGVNKTRMIANYGDGNGKIIKPAIIKLYGTQYIFVNNDTSIKYFQTSGL